MEEPSVIPRGKSAGKERSDLYKVCYANLKLYRKYEMNRFEDEWRHLDIGKISKEIGVSKQKISSWFKNNRIPGQRIKALMELRGSTLTYEDLGPFITSR